MDSLWIDFVNSDWHDHRGSGRHEDRLDSDRWLWALSRRWELDRSGLKEPASLDALRRLRALLQRLVRQLVDERPVEGRDLQALNRYLAAGPVRTKLQFDGDAYHLQMAPAEPGLPGTLFRIASSFATYLVEQDPARLRICDNPDCLWVFHDETRSRTRRWCGDGCGNLMKVRRFRAKDQ